MPNETHRDDDLKPSELPPTEAAEPTGLPQERIGPYKLLDKLGEGGMGEVWLAEQQEPVKRKVALKVIKQGMDTKQVVARFEAERQALAMMDHPAIAKVYDAGATPRGLPYFVMEHVKGVPITEHCDRQRLTNQQRLDLFIQACEGVQHAHQKAIIHRDLKPANVLVSVQDGKATPKIIDFGVAKATAQSLTDKTMHTQLGVMIGTPAYMSPEQAEMTGQDIDTRTDVYALGVILYELMVGALPFDMKDFQQAGIEAMVRKIREDEPPKPSTRLSTLGEHSTQSAKKRKTELPALKRELTGDLDWITLKALDKDRSRRYDSPKDLAEDIERYMTDQPVLARPPSAAYRAKKFVRRNTVGVVAAAAGVLVLIAFTVTMAIQANRIAAERDRANLEAATAQQVSDFMEGMFEVSDPGEARGNTVTAREVLDKGAEKIEQELVEQPLVQARLMLTMGSVYQELGLYDQSLPLLERAVALREEELGPKHADLADAVHALANLYNRMGQLAEAEPRYHRAIAIREETLGPDHPSVARGLNNLAVLYRRLERYSEAEALYQRALSIMEKTQGPDHADVAAGLNNLAIIYDAMGRYDEVEPLLQRSLTIRKKALGADHPSVGLSLASLANLYETQGKYAEAESHYRRALALWEKSLGTDHPQVAITQNYLGSLYTTMGRHDEAEPLLRDSVPVLEKALGPEHPSVASSLSSLAAHYAELGRYAEAEPINERALSLREEALGPDHPDVGRSLNALANVYRDQNRLAEAEPLYRRALGIGEKIGTDDPMVGWTLHELAKLHARQGKTAQAEQAYRRALSIREKALGADPTAVAETLEDYAELLRNIGRSGEAVQMEARAKSIRAGE
jgi:serine/threonine protein kinase/Tfp pilus assembly protein PilF